MRSADGGQESPDHSTCLAGGEILRPVALPCGCCLRSDSSGVPRAHDFPPLFCTPEPSAPETYHDVPSNTLTCPLTCREGWTAGSSPPVTRRPLRAGRSRVVRRFRPVPFASRRSTFRLLMVAPFAGLCVITAARSESKACSTWPATLTARCEATLARSDRAVGRPGVGLQAAGTHESGKRPDRERPRCRAPSRPSADVRRPGWTRILCRRPETQEAQVGTAHRVSGAPRRPGPGPRPAESVIS